MIAQPLAATGDMPSSEADKLFWTIFNGQDVRVNEQEIDREKLRLVLISYGIEASEAQIIINYYLKIGAIAQYNTTTLIKTVIYEELMRMKGQVDSANLELDKAKETKERASYFKIPKELLHRVSAGCSLSNDFAMIKVNENNEVERLIPDKDWIKEKEGGS